MKLLIFLFAINVIASNMLFSQDTVVAYFNKNWKEVSNKDIAVYYRKAFVDSNNKWVVNDYFMSKQIQMSGSYKSKKLKAKEGYFTYYYENGERKLEGHYVNDNKEGDWKSWHDNGKIKSEGKYFLGDLEGVWKYYYDNGVQRSQGKYSTNLAEGIWEYWYDSGEKKAQGKYIYDEKDGIWNYWYTNGQLAFIETYSNGVIVSIFSYFENGEKKFGGHFERGQMHNVWTYWNVDGRVSLKGKYNYGSKIGVWIRYFPEGEMKIHYKNDVKQGENLGGIVIIE